MTKVFVRYPDSRMRERMAVEIQTSTKAPVYNARTNSQISILSLTDEAQDLLKQAGAVIYENVRLDKFSGEGEDEKPQLTTCAGLPLGKSIDDVLDRINAPKAWERSTGKGVTIVILDSGIDGTRPEFDGRHSDVDIASNYHGQHWHDDSGHGTMCAAIACAKKNSLAKHNGVAPDANLISARTTFDTDDIFLIFEELITCKASGKVTGPLVVNNSYGRRICAPFHKLPRDHPYLEVVELAVSSGITVVFAAGNNHCECKHDAKSYEPNSIWAANSVDNILCVGAVDWNDSNTDPATPHSNSSRGPGQWSCNHPKPDCVAPCYGEVLWGTSYMYLPWWGTSGAAPQVSGLAALLLSLNPGMRPDEIANIVRSSCKDLAAHEYCVGKGLIDCFNAVAAL
jgi:Subtilisin-like serine proteases